MSLIELTSSFSSSSSRVVVVFEEIPILIVLERILVVLMLIEFESANCRILLDVESILSNLKLTLSSSFLKLFELGRSSSVVDSKVEIPRMVVILMMIVLRLLQGIHQRSILSAQARRAHPRTKKEEGGRCGEVDDDLFDDQHKGIEL